MRETKEFTTPGGHTVVLNTYLTGRESSQLKEIMYGAMKMNVGDIAAGGAVSMNEIPGSFLAEQERRVLSFLLVSFDGNTENPVEHMLGEYPSTEYDAVIKEINKIQNPTTPEK